MCYSGYNAQNWAHKYAPVVTVLRIKFNVVTLRDISTSYKKESLYETHRADRLQDVINRLLGCCAVYNW
jgi:hypothetical protein